VRAAVLSLIYRLIVRHNWKIFENKLWQNVLRNGVDLCPPKINVLICTCHGASRRV